MDETKFVKSTIWIVTIGYDCEHVGAYARESDAEEEYQRIKKVNEGRNTPIGMEEVDFYTPKQSPWATYVQPEVKIQHESLKR